MQCTSVNTLSTDMMSLEKGKKRKKRKVRKYTELLQGNSEIFFEVVKKFIPFPLSVTSASTKETKTSVKNLKADKLHDFIISDGVTVAPKPKKKKNPSEEYHKVDIQMFDNREILESRLMEDDPVIFVHDKLQQMKLSQQDLREILESFHTHKEDLHEELSEHDAPLLALEESQVADVPELEEETHVFEEPPVVVKKKQEKPIKKEASGTYKSKYHKTHEDEMRHKAKSLSNCLYSYVELCIATGMINRGFSTILNYRYKYQRQSETRKTVLSVELYNMVLSGFAEKVRVLISVSPWYWSQSSHSRETGNESKKLWISWERMK